MAITEAIEAETEKLKILIEHDEILSFLYCLKPQRIDWLKGINNIAPHSISVLSDAFFSGDTVKIDAFKGKAATELMPLTQESPLLIKELLNIKEEQETGDGGVGKSAFTHQLISGTYHPTPEDFYCKQMTVDNEEAILNIYDTDVRDKYLRICEGFIIMYSVTSDDSFQEVRNLREKLLNITDDEKIPVVLVGNKCDLTEDREVPTEIGQSLASEFHWKFLECSAKTKTNVVEAFEEVVKSIRDYRMGSSWDVIQSLIDLGKIRPTTLETITTLIEALGHLSYKVRKAATDTLIKLTQHSSEGMDMLIGVLGNKG
jgi:GTPase KRas protein